MSHSVLQKGHHQQIKLRLRKIILMYENGHKSFGQIIEWMSEFNEQLTSIRNVVTSKCSRDGILLNSPLCVAPHYEGSSTISALQKPFYLFLPLSTHLNLATIIVFTELNNWFYSLCRLMF